MIGVAAETFLLLDEETRTILFVADFAICIVFLIDFASNLIAAENKWKYLRLWGWIDLLSSIPAVDVLRWGRSIRLLRLLRLLRGVRSTKSLMKSAPQDRAEYSMAFAGLLTVVILTVGSTVIRHVETLPDSNIKTAQDALWWSFVTMTTVGYGDLYPVTAAGRLVAVVLMVVGVSLFAAFSGLAATFLLSPGEEEQEQELAMIRKELAEIRSALRQLSK